MKYDNLRDNLISILNSFDYRFKMYNEDGKATSNPYLARYFFVDRPNMMFILNDDDNVLEFHRSNFNFQTFKKILNMVRRITKKYFIHLNVSTYNRNITPKTFSRDVMRRKMNFTNKIVETKSPYNSHIDVLVEYNNNQLKVNNFIVDNNNKDVSIIENVLESYYRGIISSESVNSLMFIYEHRDINPSKFSKIIKNLQHITKRE